MSEHVNDCDCCQRKLAALRIAGTIDGVHLRQRDAYRGILTDLIAELRDWYDKPPSLTYSAVATATSRAEARLREAAGTDGAALPIHRTEAGWPRCATCDGGGCHDCTDPA